MIALYNLRKKGTILTLEEDELLAEMVRNYPCFYRKKPQKNKQTWKEHKERKKKSLKGKKETIVLWPIIPFKHSMPSPSVKCISPALHILCVLCVFYVFMYFMCIKIKSKTLKYEKGVTCRWIWKCDWNN